MSGPVQLDGGVSVALGAVLARAGEGTIYEIADRPEWVAKVFHPDLRDLSDKRDKVVAMIASPPEGAVQADGFVVLTWPLHNISDGIEGGVGYVMRRIDTADAVEIHTVSNPSNRMNPLPAAPQWTPHATWLHLVNVAANLCVAVDAVHLVDAVIGDFQERNILVHDTTRVTLVDCDSMQFTAGTGRQFLCGVGRPEFTAPELAGADLKTVARERPSDLFALAVHIHLLLMAGNHPFLRGDWTGGGEQPDAMTLAKSGDWAGGPGSRLRTHPLAPPITFLPSAIQALFTRAFTDGARDPSARPSAAEWRRALLDIQVTNCSRGHKIPVGTKPCPWCAIDAELARRKAQHAAAPVAATQTILRAEAPPAKASPAKAPRVEPPRVKASVVARPQLSDPDDPDDVLGGPLDANDRAFFVAVAIVVAVLIGLAVAFISNHRPISPSEASQPVGSLPLPARECDPPVEGTYRHAAAGNDVTSCPFALSVRAVVNDGGTPFPGTIDVYDPDTQQTYAQDCLFDQMLTCRGGNGAVVYLY